MIRINHSVGECSVDGNCEKPSFMMTNKLGGFCWFDAMLSKSRYQGVYFSQGDRIFRVIEDIQQGEEIIGLKNKFWCVERVGKENQERFFMPDKKNLFHYESGKKSYVFLDFKEAYSDKYANYSTEEIDNMVIVTFEVEKEKHYLVIRYSGQFKPEKRWIEREYSYDAERKSYPCKRGVYFLGEFSGGETFFSFSDKKEEAIRGVYESKELKSFEHEKKTRIRTLCDNKTMEKVGMAYDACKVQLSNLSDGQGMFAGLPWFFQYWSRDDLISLKALKKSESETARKILLGWLNSLSEGIIMNSKKNYDGRLEGRSADAFGWLLKRIEDFPDILVGNQNILEKFFETLDGEILTLGADSWMDSIMRYNPIEVQAMKLYALKMAGKLMAPKGVPSAEGNKSYTFKGDTFKSKFKNLEKALKEKVLTQYYDNGWLFDYDIDYKPGSNDKKIRPNIFIVYYFYPELLSKKEWESVFDNELPEMWAEWGGLSTISKKDKLFHANYTGEEPGSYHNGDSWFWINNLAGICLTDLNKKKYYEYIKKILNASTNEILFSGAIGNHAELSSFSSLKSEGAPCQAFSAAMFVEFVEKLKES